MKRLAVALALIGVLLAVSADPTEAQSYPDRLKKMLLVLDDQQVSVDFKEKPLSEVLRFFSTYTGVNIVMAPILTSEMDEAELEVSLTLSKVSVRNALNIILDLKGLGMVYRHGVILVTTPKDARGKPVLRMYSIADLTMRIRDFPAPDLMLRPSGAEGFGSIGGVEEEGREHAFADSEFLLDLVTENTGADTWEDEGVRISVTDRFMVVRTYPSVHRQIGGLLDMLRAYR